MSILNEREAIEARDLYRIFRQPPDINLFAPAIAPAFFEAPARAKMDREERRRYTTERQALERQNGYNFGLSTKGQISAFAGKQFATSHKHEMENRIR